MKIIARSVWWLIRGSFWQMLATMFLVWWLLLLWNILMTVSYNTTVVSDTVQPKLWMYFYLNQWLDEEKDGQTVMSMVEELNEAWLETSFYTKQEAFARLSQHLPTILEDFRNYWLENPLPPTLYVLFGTDEQYQIMKAIMVRYDGLIANANELTQWVTFSDQEQRIQTTINVMSGVKQWSIALVGVIMITIIAFLWYALSATILKFREQLLVEKLLWAYGRQVILPFLLYAWVIMLWGFVLFLWWAMRLSWVADGYTLDMFGKSFTSLALPREWLWKLLLIELWALLWITLVASYGIVVARLRRI